MDKPLELTFKNVERTPDIEALVYEKVAILEDVCGSLNSVSVIIEKENASLNDRSAWRVLIDMRAAPGHELVVRHKPGDGEATDNLAYIIRDTFQAATRRLRKLSEQQNGHIKKHPEQETGAVVDKLIRDEGYGFLRTIDNREIYFHQNSVLHHDWERLEIGTGVRYVEESGEEGPQASTVQIVAKADKL